MPTVDKRLLEIDAAAKLPLFPAGIGRLLGAPPTDTNFYAGILGAVLFGIGIVRRHRENQLFSALHAERILPFQRS